MPSPTRVSALCEPAEEASGAELVAKSEVALQPLAGGFDFALDALAGPTVDLCQLLGDAANHPVGLGLDEGRTGAPVQHVLDRAGALDLGRPLVLPPQTIGPFRRERAQPAATRIVPVEAMRAAVRASVPPGTEELNLRAFDAGRAAFEADYGQPAELAGTQDGGS